MAEHSPHRGVCSRSVEYLTVNQVASILMSQEKKSSNVMRQIDENLRRVYKDDQPDEVPDRFRELLDRLKAQDKPDE
ncbi:NepR family anti-sigma factor [Palleronia aestuarii]|uniref:NepR family anti-sigma factor n=1 Tax=Palleronia aestuarii TaxID=568105 RepID=UPI0027E50089|nr:NepR family anti-sigma factor [Palleronia aestuarii]